MNTIKQQNKTNRRKTANDALTTQLPASVIATFGLVLCAGISSRSRGDVQ